MVEPPSDSCGLMRGEKKNDKLSVFSLHQFLFKELCNFKSGGYFCIALQGQLEIDEEN